MPEVPVTFRHALTITMRNDRHVTIDTPAELAPILSWLATLPLEEIGIEPIGLRRVYDRYHRRPPAVTAPLAGPSEP
jgi:ABC-2 type transport system ATP-binding protein